MENFSKISNEFKKITNIELVVRETNFLGDEVLRKDNLFSLIAQLYFDHPSKVKKLETKIGRWIAKDKQSETLYSLAGYVAYVRENFTQAKKYFMKALSLNPENYDNWHDLSFALRHLNEVKISNGINFNHDLLIHYYRRLGLKGDYTTLRELIKEINKKTGI